MHFHSDGTEVLNCICAFGPVAVGICPLVQVSQANGGSGLKHRHVSSFQGGIHQEVLVPQDTASLIFFLMALFVKNTLFWDSMQRSLS